MSGRLPHGESTIHQARYCARVVCRLNFRRNEERERNTHRNTTIIIIIIVMIIYFVVCTFWDLVIFLKSYLAGRQERSLLASHMTMGLVLHCGLSIHTDGGCVRHRWQTQHINTQHYTYMIEKGVLHFSGHTKNVMT